MAAAALRFLAHCFEMTLPVSLSTRAGRGRIFIFFFSSSLLLLSLSVVRQLTSPSLPARLSFHASFSLSLRSRSRELPRHCLPGAARVGDGRKGGGRKEVGKERRREGEQIVCQACGEAVEFCRLPR